MGLKWGGLWVWLSIALILVIQLSLIAFWVEPYPNWGDDLSYILFFDIRISDVFSSISSYILPFHGGIHANLCLKIYVILTGLFASKFHFTALILVANALLLPILYCFIQYARLSGKSSMHFVGISLLLLSLKGQVDNFSLVGVMQHGFTVLIIVWIAYVMTIQKRYVVGVLLANASLLLISTESLGLLFFSNLLIAIYRHRYRYYLWVLSVLCIVLYYSGIQLSSEILGIKDGGIHVNMAIFPAVFIFLGAIVSRVSVAFLLGVICFLGIAYPVLRSIKTVFKKGNERMLFLPMIFFSMASIGFLIHLGRGVDDAGQVGFGVLLAHRFSFYHVIPLVLIYLSILEIKPDLSRRLQGFMVLGALGFYGLNIRTQMPLVEADQRRILCDAYVMKTQQTCLSYPMDSLNAKNLVEKKWYVWPDFSTISALRKQSPVLYTRMEEGEISQLRCLTSEDSPYFALLVNGKKYVISGHSVPGNAYQIDLNRKQLAELGSFQVVQLTR